MNPLLQSLLEKAAFDTGWEVVEEHRLFRSGRHPGVLVATDLGRALQIDFVGNPEDLLPAAFPAFAAPDDTLLLPFEPERFTDVLPAIGTIFRTAAANALAEPPAAATERLATIRRRVGQAAYREDLFSLWDGACAVTGLAEPALLRASHAKPWHLASAAERLDPFNGFPLTIPLDALFDGGWITFADDGSLLPSPLLSPAAATVFGIHSSLRLRRTPSPRHLHYLDWHRRNLFRGAAP